MAAIPSLHAGLSAMVAMFLWRRVRWAWRAVLLIYVLTMAFALVYSAEHYVIDILLGWALAAVVMLVFGRLEARRSRTDNVSPGRSAEFDEPAGDLGGGLPVEGAVDPVGNVADVGRGDHVVQRAQRMRGRQWLDVEHVEARGRDAARPQRPDQGLLVDDRPREVLTNIAVGFIDASSAAPTRPRVRSLSTKWMVSTSARPNSSSLDTYATPARSAACRVRLVLHAITSIPKAVPTRATRVPTLPSPSTPSTAPPSWRPTDVCHPRRAPRAFRRRSGERRPR
ncbi:PAP2 superfamily protein [Mycobacterium xenopi 4042]|uniref:PAP2 superfamily protein n=1 Tax=Mycobacterium xenopi 4042 TaxID=1299334 RepID=X7Z4C5_MYCXE|nr:PAP2 superfamily protein [Mycobacterium xenopi 4042]